MGFFDSLMETFLDDHVRREKRFEESVMKRFPRKYFTFAVASLPEASANEGSAKSKKKARYLVTHKPTNGEFVLELTYYPHMDQQVSLEFCTSDHFALDKKFMETEKIPVIFIVGLGGVDNFGGEDLFILPLAAIKNPVLTPEQFDMYRKKPQTEFFWEHGHLS
jgi:hypothetical protein